MVGTRATLSPALRQAFTLARSGASLRFTETAPVIGVRWLGAFLCDNREVMKS